MLQREEVAGRSRYYMVATTAEFGRERAGEAETGLDLPTLRRRHAEYYLTAARRFDETPMENWRALEPDLDNIATGFETAIVAMEATLGAPLDDLLSGWESQLKRRTEEGEGSLAGEYALALKNFVFRRRPAQGERWLRAGLVAWAAAGHGQRVALFCNELGLIHKARGDYAAALEWYGKSVAIKEKLGDQAGLATTYNNIASIHYARGDYAAALEWYGKSVAIFERLGAKASAATLQKNIEVLKETMRRQP
ncbi:MAG: tetratricopeptide repeat protein [Anaerolineae bacterium]|nr:tetratricopeptide repeat protein [Anaerolineae bacterium]